MFSKGRILEPLLGSMALPGIFPNVAYQGYLLNDGGVVDNFPSVIAQKQYPKHRIIGVVLDTFKKHQTPKNLIETLSISLGIMIGKDVIRRSQKLDIVFHEPIDCEVWDVNKRKWKKAFEQGYASGVKRFKGL